VVYTNDIVKIGLNPTKFFFTAFTLPGSLLSAIVYSDYFRFPMKLLKKLLNRINSFDIFKFEINGKNSIG
jgi:hypothetical protein